MMIRNLTSADRPALYRAFQAGFSDYSVNILSDYASFSARLDRIGMAPELSAGVFDEGEILAFVIHGFGIFEGKKTVYNGGTAVRPAARRKGHIREIYRFLEPKFRAAGLHQCVLEVISDNIPAISLYTSIGFEAGRILFTYRIASPGMAIAGRPKLKILQRKAEIGILPHAFGSGRVSWQNSPESVVRCPAGETVFTAFYEDRAVGAISLDLQTGKVSALGVKKNFRRRGFGRVLLQIALEAQRATGLTFINIDAEATGFRTFLGRFGAKEVLMQLEMNKVFLSKF